MGKLLSRFQEKFDHKLENTTKLENISEPLRSELKALYGEKGKNSLNVNLMACLINGIYTEKINEFLFSVRLLKVLVESDGNLKRETVGSIEFKSFKAFLIKHKIINIMTNSSNFGSGGKNQVAARCKLIDVEILDLLKKSKSASSDEAYEFSGDEEMSEEQQYYEDNLAVPNIDSRLLKKIKERTKSKKNGVGNVQVSEGIDLDKLIKDIHQEKSTYLLTLSWNKVLDNLDEIRRLREKGKVKEAHNIILEMHKTRARIYKEDTRNRFPLPLDEAIKNCHKNKS